MTAIITVSPKKPPMNVSMSRIQINVVNLLSQEHELNFAHKYHPNVYDEEGHMVWVDHPEGKMNYDKTKVQQVILTDKSKLAVREYDQQFKVTLERRIKKLLQSYFNPLEKSVQGFTIELAVSALITDEPQYTGKDGNELKEIVVYDRDAKTFAPFNESQHKTIFTKSKPLATSHSP